MRDLMLFEQAVAQYFQPICSRLEMPLFKVDDGIYEIPTAFFVMRIRLHTGHARGLNVILRQTSICDFEDYKPGIQYGIGCFMRFYGEQFEHLNIFTDEDFLKQARSFAGASERLCIPYLLGQKNDLKQIAQMMEESGKEEAGQIRQMMRNIERNMPTVRQEWPIVLPPEEGEKCRTAKEIQLTGIDFLGDQDGDSERILKNGLVKLLTGNQNIKAAYLARFIGYRAPANAALCLTKRGGGNQEITELICPVFESVFGSSEQLNVGFLSGEQESSIAKVCHAFFESGC